MVDDTKTGPASAGPKAKTDGRLTVADITSGREAWLVALRAALMAREKAYNDAQSTSPNAPIRADLENFVALKQYSADALRADYEDTVRQFEAQEDAARIEASDRLAKTNTKLAHVQAWLAGAITLATIAQAIIAAVK